MALLFDGDDVICVSILPARRVRLCAMQRPRSRSGSATLHSTSINGYSMRGQRIYIGRQLMASQRNDGRKSPPDILASSRAARCGCFPPSLDHASILPAILKSLQPPPTSVANDVYRLDCHWSKNGILPYPNPRATRSILVKDFVQLVGPRVWFWCFLSTGPMDRERETVLYGSAERKMEHGNCVYYWSQGARRCFGCSLLALPCFHVTLNGRKRTDIWQRGGRCIIRHRVCGERRERA